MTRAERQARRAARDRSRPDPEFPPLREVTAFAAELAGKPMDQAVDDLIEWLDARISVDLPGDGPWSQAGEALLEALDGPVMRAVARSILRGVRAPAPDRRHP